MATQQEFSEEQLTAARSRLWQQQGEPLLTEEAAAEFVERFGLVLFAPGRLNVPAPTLVEATLGEARPAASVADAAVARSLVARLMASGAAVPLNLMGGPGDAADFVASAAVLPFVFTLRGDKNWKKAPSTSGSVKVSPLALRVFETLTERGALTAAELAADLGREVTEAAIVRALNELWQMLRVFPQYGAGEAPTLWQLATQRFTRALKAGANAGQPTALSALASLYLRQGIAATADDVETFLSPVAARSRVRELLHGLTAARELGEVVVAGKTLLHVADELPVFEAIVPVAAAEDAGDGAEAPVAERARVEFSETEVAEPGRIRRFAGGRAPQGGGEERRPARREGGAFARKPRTGDGGTVREAGREGGSRPQRRAFGASAPAGERPREFTRPWDEERRPARSRGEEGEERPERRPRREDFGAGQGERRRPGGFGRAGQRPERASGERGEGRPFRPRREEGAAGEGRSFTKRPFQKREGAEGRPFRPRREEGAAGEGRSFAKRPFQKREGGEGRPPRTGGKPFGARPGSASRGGGFRREGSEQGAGARRPRPAGEKRGSYPARGASRPGGGGRSARPTGSRGAAFGGNQGRRTAGKPARPKREAEE